MQGGSGRKKEVGRNARQGGWGRVRKKEKRKGERDRGRRDEGGVSFD